MTANADTAHTREGAEQLARTVSDYWLSRGHLVAVWVQSVSTPKGVMYAIKSDLVAGKACVTLEATA